MTDAPAAKMPTNPMTIPPGATPAVTGSEGVQTLQPAAAGVALKIAGASPADTEHMGAVLGDHVSQGNSTTMAFAVAAFRDAQASREMLRDQIERVSKDRDETHEKYHEEAKSAAVLQTQLKWSSKLDRFQTWAFGLGGILVGAGLGGAVQTEKLRWVDSLLIAAGLILMWIGSPLANRDGAK